MGGFGFSAMKQQLADKTAAAKKEQALVPPPAPPPSTLTTEASNIGAAKLAADAQRKRSIAGSTLATATPASSVTSPTAGAQPRSLIGY